MPTRILLAAFALFTILDSARAAPPVASFIYPAGGQRGTEVPVRVGGLFVHDRCHFALDGLGVSASPTLKKTDRIWFEGPVLAMPESQQPEDYPVDLLGSVSVDATAQLGARKGHLWTSQGVATGLIFVVGELPEVVETEIDGEPIPEKLAAVPVTANGRIFPREDSDLWEVKLKRGQTLSTLATTAGIRSPLRARLEILDGEGKVLAETSARTAVGFDASAKCTAPADGVYRVRISDARGLGGPAFVYRLTLTTDPVAESVFPLGGQRGSKIDVDWTGQKVPVTIPLDAPANWSHPFGIQAIPFDVDDLSEFTDSSKPVIAPAILNGRIEKNGTATWKVRFPTSKKYEIELRAKKLGSPLCGSVGVLNPQGVEIAKQTGADLDSDPTIGLTPNADGVYTIWVRDRFRNRGGPEFGYRLRIREAPAAVPDFRIKLAVDSLNIPRGGTAKLKLTAERLGGFNGSIDLAFAGLPAGVTAPQAMIAVGQATVDVPLSAEALAVVRVGRVAVTGRVTIADKPVSRTEVLLVAVAVPTPFAYEGEFTSATAPRGQPYGRNFKLVRNGFAGPLTVGLADRQFRHLQGVTGPSVAVVPGQNEFAYFADLPPWIEMGRTCRVCIVVAGTVKDPDGTEHTVSFTSNEQNHQLIVVPEPGRLGIDLAKAVLAVAPGETVRVPVRIARAKGLTGDVKVELVLPAHWRGVSAAAITIPKDKETGELVLKLGAGEIGPFNAPAAVKATGGAVVAEAKLELFKRE